MRNKWLILCLLLAIFAVGGIGIYLYQTSAKHTVGDFSSFPYAVQQADKLVFERGADRFEIARIHGVWRVTQPIEAALSEWGTGALDQLMRSRIFVDTREPANSSLAGEDYRRQANAVTVGFWNGETPIARVTVGSGKREATADAERRWFFVEGDETAYRVFVPLTDIGDVLMQPLSAWRDTLLSRIDARDITKITYRTIADELVLDRNGEASADNVQGWRIATASGRDIDSDALEKFVIDERRVATILDLLSALFVDDFADGVSWEKAAPKGVLATIEVAHGEKVTVLEVGDEIDYQQYPQYALHGEGARFIRLAGASQIAVVSARRLLGMMPGFSDLRSKKVWQLASTSFSAIEVRYGAEKRRYQPGDAKVWVDVEDGVQHAVDEAKLIAFIKVLSKLEALRYATQEERTESLNAGEILIFEHGSTEPAHKIVLGGSHEGLYRFAQADGGPVFAISEVITKILLDDIRVSSQSQR